VKGFAPGRVEILGNHTDYNQGVVLAAALDLGITAEAERLSGRIIRLKSGGETNAVELNPDNLEPQGTWSDYPAGVIQILRQEGFDIHGIDLSFSSDLPTGAGLSSSAALEVATAMVLDQCFDLGLKPMTLAKICRKAENSFVGVNCGLLDQATSVFGEKGKLVLLDCRDESTSTIPFPEGCGLLIIDSMVKHALTSGEYNERREDCFAAAKALGVDSLRDARTEDLDDLPDRVRKRASHVTGEIERVRRGIGYLRNNEIEAFGELMTASQESSIHHFENSTPELDLLCRLVIGQEGVYGARLTGGGFGGAIVAIGRDEALDFAARATADLYRTQTGHQARTLICHPGSGAWQFACRSIPQ